MTVEDTRLLEQPSVSKKASVQVLLNSTTSSEFSARVEKKSDYYPYYFVFIFVVADHIQRTAEI